MEMMPILLQEMEQEAQTTRKMLSIIPNDKYDWAPHPKSMTIKHLAAHIAELPGWASMVLNTAELDFAVEPYTPHNITNTPDLLTYFEKNLADTLTELRKAKDEQLKDTWVLRNGDVVYSKSSKLEMIRTTYCQIVHHRAQMGVYLRLLNIPIPGSYGPSADEQSLK